MTATQSKSLQGSHWYVKVACTNEAADTLAHQDLTDMLSHTDTLAYTDTLAQERLENDVTHTSLPSRAGLLAGSGRTGWEHGALETTLPACLDHRPWAQRPGKKKKKREERDILLSVCFRPS